MSDIQQLNANIKNIYIYLKDVLIPLFLKYRVTQDGFKNGLI